MDMRKLSRRRFTKGKYLTREDFVIVLGDFGVIWSRTPSKEEDYWRKWLQDKPWTTLFVDGNHENHEILAELPTVPMFGSNVGVAFDNIYHLKRGEVYDIGGKLFFTMGGAESIDKESRLDRISWWVEETPSWAEFENGFKNLDRYNNKVDYILGHTCPTEVGHKYLEKLHLSSCEKCSDPTSAYFSDLVKTVSFKGFYFGHWHDDWDYDKYHMLYQKVVEIL
jgi:hypothetical protein